MRPRRCVGRDINTLELGCRLLPKLDTVLDSISSRHATFDFFLAFLFFFSFSGINHWLECKELAVAMMGLAPVANGNNQHTQMRTHSRADTNQQASRQAG